MLWHPNIKPSDNTATKIFVTNNVFFIFLILCLVALRFCRFIGSTSKEILESARYVHDSRRGLIILPTRKRVLAPARLRRAA